MLHSARWQLRLRGMGYNVASSCCRGYLLTQVAGGVWADKFGGKPILGFGVIWWSIATALTPLAAQLGLPVSLYARLT
jgi:MFS transporter, ACS family, solute carrier family 17 (sodium-dependent inorganic phosphate cotransporter), other